MSAAADSAGFETIRFEVDDGVAVITLDRPERGNAINGRMSRELPEAWERIKRNAGIACAVVAASGERAFCTGFDIAEVAGGDATIGRADAQGLRASLELTALQKRCWKPVVTAVGGAAAGGGLHFVADSDLVLCSDDAKFFDTHVAVGLVAALGPIGLARRMALEPVWRTALTGGRERLDAARALEVGLVGEVVARDRLLPRALELARAIAANAPTALAETKRAIWESLDCGLAEAGRRGKAAIERYRDHPDAREGASAFAERREPRWKGLSL